MKREILFRGKREDNGEWVEGDLLRLGVTSFISVHDYERPNKNFAVNPETVGQFTGLPDKNGVKIFEGDIVRHEDWNIRFGKYIAEIKEVYFDTELLQFGLKETFILFYSESHNEFEVIGNIHDNPELLK